MSISNFWMAFKLKEHSMAKTYLWKNAYVVSEKIAIAAAQSSFVSSLLIYIQYFIGEYWGLAMQLYLE